VHGWPQETVQASGRTVLLVEEGVNLVGHLREKGQVLPRKTLGTFPRLSILVVRIARTIGGQLHMNDGSIDEKGRYTNSKPALEGGELDFARSVITVVEDGGFEMLWRVGLA
jgi:hypothetical protein